MTPPSRNFAVKTERGKPRSTNVATPPGLVKLLAEIPFGRNSRSAVVNPAAAEAR